MILGLFVGCGVAVCLSIVTGCWRSGQEEPRAAGDRTPAEPTRSADLENLTTNADPSAASSDTVQTRLSAIKAEVESKRKPETTADPPEKSGKDVPAIQPVISAEAGMSAQEFIVSFGEAIVKGDSAAISTLLQKAPRSTEAVNALKGFITAEGASKDMRRYAAEALVCIGTQESVGFVLDQVLAAQRAGDSSAASTLLYSLDSPTTTEGAQVLFDLLLGTGRYAENQAALPGEFRDAARKALRNAPDREGIGNLAAQLYLDPEISGRNEAVSELLDGVALPSMLSSLAIRSYQEGAPENAVQFLDRITRVDDQGAVQALVQAGSTESRLFNAAAERLYAWSLQHPQQAQPGLFLEYITDSNRTPSERILAAYGLAGVANKEEALRTYSKVLAQETNPEVRAGLAALEGYWTQNQPQK